MKVRTGFVSNSSSSSFLIVGVEKKWGTPKDNHHYDLNNILEEMARNRDTDLDGFLEMLDSEINHGYTNYDGFTIYGTDGEIYYIGVDIETHLKEGKTVPELIHLFEDAIRKKYKVDVKADLYYGESGSG